MGFTRFPFTGFEASIVWSSTSFEGKFFVNSRRDFRAGFAMAVKRAIPLLRRIGLLPFVFTFVLHCSTSSRNSLAVSIPSSWRVEVWDRM